MNREQAWALVTEYTESESLRRHMLAVETAMRAYAVKFGADPELWGVVGLIHDFDYEKYPNMGDEEGHPLKGVSILKDKGVSEEITDAVLAHAEEITGVKPETPMQKALVAVDELTGFIIAVTLVRPSKSILDVKVKSIRKKWKDKAFAAPVNREEIEHAATALGVTLDEHLTLVLEAMKADVDKLGLRGNVN